MPTPEDIWSKLPKGQYEEILNILKDNKHLLNIADRQESSLFQSLLAGSKPGDERQELLEYMVKHPDLNWSHTSKVGNTNTSLLIRTTRSDLLLLAVKIPGMLCGGEKLAYEVAKDTITSTQQSLLAAEKRNPNSTLAQQLRTRLQELPAVVDFLRDATVLQSLETDDADLLTRLDKAGGDPTKRLGSYGGGKQLNILVTDQHKNINVWLTKRYQEVKENLTSNPHSLFGKAQRVKELELQQASLEQKYLQTKVGLIKQGLEDDAKHLSDVADHLKPGLASK